MLHQAARVGAIALAMVFVGILVAWPLGLAGMLDNRADLLIALLLGLAAFAFAELGRGILSGRHLFEAYGRYFAFEGGSRMVVAAAFTVIGVEIGLMTPPLGLSVYVIKSSLDDPEISLGTIFAGASPFIVITLAVTVLLMAFPALSLMLL